VQAPPHYYTPPRVSESEREGEAPPSVASRAARQDRPETATSEQAKIEEPKKKEEKKGLFRRLLNVFK